MRMRREHEGEGWGTGRRKGGVRRVGWGGGKRDNGKIEKGEKFFGLTVSFSVQLGGRNRRNHF